LKTIVFHSYKGGVGRTLLLANFALALSRLDKRVVMLDFDFDSPGLPFKFDLEDKIQKGYVDYLVDKSSKRYNNKYSKDCLQYIKNINVKIPGEKNLWLIPTGNPASKVYWKNLASDKFNTSFYFTKAEIKGRDFSYQSLSNNIHAFIKDKELINEYFKADYLLVDAKAGSERLSVSLLLWADTVVSMFVPHKEGLFGTALIQRSLLNERIFAKLPESIQRKIDIIPVLCRIPELSQRFEETKTTVVNNFMKIWNEMNTPDTELPEPQKIWQDLMVLVENRNLEKDERLLLDNLHKHDRKVLLTHNYVEIFSRIAPLPSEKESASDSLKYWFNELKMRQDFIILEKYFEDHSYIGKMINPDDNEPNIALRIKTLHSMMTSIFEKASQAMELQGKTKNEIDTSIKESLFEAGKRSGESFGSKMMLSNKVWENIPEKFEKRLEEWCRFDSSVGFGKIESQQRQNDSNVFDVYIKGNAFYSEKTKKKWYDLNEFLRGYISGVLKWILYKGKEDVNVKNENKENNERTVFSFNSVKND